MVLNVKLSTINKNDFINGEGVSVSLWMQGCPHRCPGCHNPELWNYNGGVEKTIDEVLKEIYAAISANNIQRNFSVLGGEPLCPENIEDVIQIIKNVKASFPNIKVFIWTGYNLDELKNKEIFEYTDVLITGRYVQALRDITLKWRGRSNQKILYKGIDY